jgi:Na+/phosphate symporter
MIVNDDKRKCIRAIDSAILHYKFQNVLRQVKKEFVGKAGFDRKTLADHKEYYDSLKQNVNNALRIIASPNTSTEDKISAQRMIEYNQNEMNTLENSPLIEFKRRFDQMLAEDKYAQVLNQYEELRSAIESEAIPADLSQLRNYLIDIDEGVFGFVPDPEQL